MVFGNFEKNRLVLDFSEEEAKEFGLNPESGFELVKAKKGVWVLLEAPKKEVPAKPIEKKEIDEKEQKIIGLLRKKDYRERVEGQFEKLLSPSEQITLQKMLSNGTVEKFKSDPKYKMAVYRPKEQSGGKKVFEQKEKQPEEYSIETDGYMIAKTEFAAQKLSSQLGERIKNGEIKGTRAFSGEFYIIDSSLYEEKTSAVLEFLKNQKTASITEINSALKMTPTLIKIICLFLSEEGILLERRKEQYQFIE